MKPSHQLNVVLDTNVVISSLWGGIPFELIELWDKGAFCVIVSEDILDEYFAVFSRFDLLEEDIEDITILFSNPKKTKCIFPKKRIYAVKKDPTDNKFIECAVEGNADCIISGDKHIVGLKDYKGIAILSPKQFLEYIK